MKIARNGWFYDIRLAFDEQKTGFRSANNRDLKFK